MQVGRIRYSKAELKTMDTLRDTSGVLALLRLRDADTYHAVAKGSSYHSTDSKAALDSRNNQQASPGPHTRRYCVPGEFLRLSVEVTESCSDVLGSGTPKALFGL